MARAKSELQKKFFCAATFDNTNPKFFDEGVSLPSPANCFGKFIQITALKNLNLTNNLLITEKVGFEDIGFHSLGCLWINH